MNISLCLATYRRIDRLRVLLDDLVQQHRPPNEVIVVDNDATGSARAVVERRRELGAPFPIYYDIQPLQNISLTRNRTVEMANGDWIAFIDDDERASPSWLAQLAEAADRFDADGVLGPVEPVVPQHAPDWLRSGDFYSWARMETGAVVPLNKLRFGNVLLRASLLRKTAQPFDPNYGQTGGEDGDLLTRLAQDGARIVWCDEAIVREPVEAARLSLHWLLRRALRGGQDFARHTLAGRYGVITTWGRMKFFLRALIQALTAALLSLINWPTSRQRSVYWLLKAAANLGKMSLFWGWHYREYGGTST